MLGLCVAFGTLASFACNISAVKYNFPKMDATLLIVFSINCLNDRKWRKITMSWELR